MPDVNPWTEIVVPGRGVVNLDAEKVNRAVMEYDERLRFGWNPANEDWIVYVRMPREFPAAYYIEGEPVYPCLGFGNRVPTPDEAIARVRQSDSWREGNRILDRVIASQKRAEKAAKAEADELTEEVAERIEFALRKAGETSKYTKVFFSSKE